MENLYFQCSVSSSLGQVKEGFNRELFAALRPPFLQFIIDRFDGHSPGDEVHIRIGMGLKFKWVSEITDERETAEEWLFVDRGKQLPFPLTEWHHTHKVEQKGKGSLIIDDIYFSCGHPIADKIMRPILKKQFSGRAAIYQKVFGSL